MADATSPRSDAHWHQRTLERSLRSARARALSRGDRFIAAAAELLRETGEPDFTVQEVVDRSGMSLRSLYHHFATKDDVPTLVAYFSHSMTALLNMQIMHISLVDEVSGDDFWRCCLGVLSPP